MKNRRYIVIAFVLIFVVVFAFQSYGKWFGYLDSIKAEARADVEKNKAAEIEKVKTDTVNSIKSNLVASIMQEINASGQLQVPVDQGKALLLVPKELCQSIKVPTTTK